MFVWTESVTIAEDSTPPSEMKELEIRDVYLWQISERLQSSSSPLTRRTIDLNTATVRELCDDLELSVEDAQRILGLRDSLGRFDRREDLRRLGAKLYGVLKTRRTRFRLSRAPPTVAIRLRGSLAWRSPEQQQWISPWKTYARVRVALSEKVQAGCLGKKDAGEPYRYAFASAYLELEGFGPIQRLILGDYTLHAGLGLLLGRGGTFRRDFPAHESALPEPHRYADESGFFRGMALTALAFGGRARWTLCASSVARAGSFDATENDIDLNDTGLFRTATEQARWRGINERTLGTILEIFPCSHVEFGCSVIRSRLIAPESPAVEPEGSEIDGCSLFVRADAVGTVLEAELGYTFPGGMLLAGSVALPFAERSLMVMGIRHYATSSERLFSSAPGRSGLARNEQGASWSVRWRPAKQVEVASSFDLYRELAPGLRTPLARQGSESQLQARLLISAGVECELRWHFQRGSDRELSVDELGRDSWRLIEHQRQTLRLRFRHDAGRLIAFEGRIELVEVRWQDTSLRDRGWLLAQAVTLRALPHVSIAGRLALFRTGSYDSRIYLPEHDHTGGGGYTMLYGRGRRYYLILRADVGPSIRCSLKYASSRFDPPSAPDENTRERMQTSLVSFQVDALW